MAGKPAGRRGRVGLFPAAAQGPSRELGAPRGVRGPRGEGAERGLLRRGLQDRPSRCLIHLILRCVCPGEVERAAEWTVRVGCSEESGMGPHEARTPTQALIPGSVRNSGPPSV